MLKTFSVSRENQVVYLMEKSDKIYWLARTFASSCYLNMEDCICLLHGDEELRGEYGGVEGGNKAHPVVRPADTISFNLASKQENSHAMHLLIHMHERVLPSIQNSRRVYRIANLVYISVFFITNMNQCHQPRINKIGDLQMIDSFFSILR